MQIFKHGQRRAPTPKLETTVSEAARANNVVSPDAETDHVKYDQPHMSTGTMNNIFPPNYQTPQFSSKASIQAPQHDQHGKPHNTGDAPCQTPQQLAYAQQHMAPLQTNIPLMFHHQQQPQYLPAAPLTPKRPEGPQRKVSEVPPQIWAAGVGPPRGILTDSPHDSASTNPNVAHGTIPITTPLVVRQDHNNVQWVSFEYPRGRVKMEYTIRCDVESVKVDELPQEFKTENCVFSSANFPDNEYKRNHLLFKSECNMVGWALAQLNPCLRGKRGLIQRAVDSWRNHDQDPRLRSRRVRRMAKMNNWEGIQAANGGYGVGQIAGIIGARISWPTIMRTDGAQLHHHHYHETRSSGTLDAFEHYSGKHYQQPEYSIHEDASSSSSEILPGVKPQTAGALETQLYQEVRAKVNDGETPLLLHVPTIKEQRLSSESKELENRRSRPSGIASLEATELAGNIDTHEILAKLKKEVVNRLMSTFYELYQGITQDSGSDSDERDSRDGSQTSVTLKGDHDLSSPETVLDDCEDGDETPSIMQKRYGSLSHRRSMTSNKTADGKRLKRSSNDQEEDDGDRKRRKGPQTKLSNILDPLMSFACPFSKRFPERTAKCAACVFPGFVSVHRVKEHLYRNHIRPVHIGCLRCFDKFPDESLLKAHAREAQRCPKRQEPPEEEGLDQEQERQLRCKKRLGREMSDEARWRRVYQICFPDVDEAGIPSPYCDQQMSPSSQQLEHFEQFERERLPHLVRQALERAVETAPQLVQLEESVRGQLVDMIRGCQEQVYQQYRSYTTVPGQPVARNEHQMDGLPLDLTSYSPHSDRLPSSELASGLGDQFSRSSNTTSNLETLFSDPLLDCLDWFPAPGTNHDISLDNMFDLSSSSNLLTMQDSPDYDSVGPLLRMNGPKS